MRRNWVMFIILGSITRSLSQDFLRGQNHETGEDWFQTKWNLLVVKWLVLSEVWYLFFKNMYGTCMFSCCGLGRFGVFRILCAPFPTVQKHAYWGQLETFLHGMNPWPLAYISRSLTTRPQMNNNPNYLGGSHQGVWTIAKHDGASHTDVPKGEYLDQMRKESHADVQCV